MPTNKIKYAGPAPRAPVQIKYQKPNELKPDSMGARIRFMRDKLKLTQAQLGDLCGVTKSAVSQWEMGENANIKLEPFIKLLNVLNVDYQWLVWGDAGVPAHEIEAPRPKKPRGRPRKKAA